jgi:hypothetical protein
MAKTPPQLLSFGVRDNIGSKKLSRAPLSCIDPQKKKLIAIWWINQHLGAMAQAGDPAAIVDPVLQDDLAAGLGWARSTYTKNWMMFSARSCPKCGGAETKIQEDWQIVCAKCGTLPAEWSDERRLAWSDLMKEIVKAHPRWNRRRRRNEAQRQITAQRRIRKHVACILTRNGGWSQANSYAEAMPDELRPKIERQEDPGFEAGILARQFGEKFFDREAYKKLGIPTNGFDKSVGWNLDPKLPYARKCTCQLRKGQRRFDFQKVCPKCEGRGFVTDGPMPYLGRLFYQILEGVLGLRKKISVCRTCNEIWDGSRTGCCKCGDQGEVTKEAGILEGWRQIDIARIMGCNVSTVRKYEHAYAALMIIRTIPGRVWRKCRKCDREYSGSCKSCGAQGDKVIRREAHKYLYLPTRTMDRELVQSERNRLDAVVKRNERMKLQQRQMECLVKAVALAKQLLGEWEGQEHYLESFWKEMHRRMAGNADHARLVNVLFPLQRE